MFAKYAPAILLVFSLGFGFLLSWTESHEKELPLLLEEDFNSGSAHWEFTDPKVWRVIEDQGDPALALVANSDYEPEVRSPLNIALYKDIWVSDFVLELELKSTAREYDHRSLCLFFNWQSPNNFYYVHLGKRADPHANSIFLVNDEPRVSIASQRTSGTPWRNDTYHTVRIERQVSTGSIKVFWDGSEEAVMEATDKTFTLGRVGVGSFDDPGVFDNIKVWGKTVENKP